MRTAPLLPYFFISSRQIQLDKAALVWSDILRLFVNTLTTDDKYYHRNMQNFSQQLETPLSSKQKNFSRFFIAFRKCIWNLENFEKKYEYPRLILSKIINSKRGGYLNF